MENENKMISLSHGNRMMNSFFRLLVVFAIVLVPMASVYAQDPPPPEVGIPNIPD